MAASLHTVTAYCPVDFLLTVISALVSCKTTTCDFKGKTDVVPQGERERERERERQRVSLLTDNWAFIKAPHNHLLYH